ncbi:response regulator [Aliigemmobacter aestuarii]|uniref:histidine kinase n=1 Tax=Aliigemmobacter aestuarii TaxID=1445661 RepID=A0A4S3MKM2_9RHOB|nr:ATP-binding protein [Gemmobacter aestuarii]THD82313.1 response regulator [Gemmobacter aestuarii]
MICATATILLLSLELSRRLHAIQEAPTDNLQWNVTQIELDAALLENAILVASATPSGSLDDLRRRFDMLYSRAATVERGAMLQRLGLVDEAQPLIERLREYLSGTVVLIDGNDEGLRASLALVRDETQALRRDLRFMAIRVIDANAARQDARRAELFTAVRNTALAGTVLLLLLASLLLIVHRLNRQAADRAREILRITNVQKATVGTSLDAIVVVDLDGLVLEFNPAAERMFGYPRSEALGRPLAALIIPERHVAAHDAGMQRMRNGGAPHVVDQGRVEMTARARSGGEFPVELSIASAQGPSGKIFIGVLRDISEARAAQSALIDARDKATAAERTKTDFIAVMSHEMRTPLNGMMAALDIIGRDGLNPRQDRFLTIAKDASRQLLRHVNDVLDISRIEAGGAPILQEAIDIEALLASLTEPLRQQAAQQGTTITLDLPAPLPPVLGDPFRLGQIVQNLISNAIKFTEDGTITVTATAQAREGGTLMVELAVRDTGIGIHACDHKRIFEDFVMVDPSFGRKVGGTGLGLAISRRLARAMGGDVTVTSAPGQGSTFTLRLPLSRAESSRPQYTPPPMPVTQLDRPLSVLVVEDNPTNRMVLEEMLTALGHSVDLAVDGAEGVAKARARAYDLVLMDLSMPRIDGWTATALIREDGASRTSRILAVTAHALTRDDPRFPTSGFDGLLTKPLTMEDLTAAAIAPDADPVPDPIRDADPVLLDDARMRDLARLGEGSMHRMLDQARHDLSRCIAAAVAATADPETCASHLHEAAGVAALIGARRLHALLQQGEQDCKSADRTELEATCTAIASAWSETERSLS